MTTDRISRLEGAYEQVDKRLEDLQQSVITLRGDINVLRNEMNSRFDGMEGRTNSLRSEIESRFQSMEGRINSRFESMEGQFNSRFDNMEGQVSSRFNQLVILIGGAWVTIIAGVMALFFGPS